MEEGRILKWLKQPGDRIEVGDIIAEVETDKADMEMEALDEGVLIEILVPEGGMVPVGGVMARLGTADEIVAADSAAPVPAAENGIAEPPPPAPTASPPVPTPAPKVRELREIRAQREPTPAEETGRLLASPVVRRMAQELSLDLSQVPGSGPGGRIVKRDLEAYTAAQAPLDATAESQADPRAESQIEPQPEARASADPPTATREPFSRMRATIAKRMAESMREAPHFYLTAEINMSEAVRLRTALKASNRVTEDVTYTHLLMKAVAIALDRHPRLNASFGGDAREYQEHINIGLAVSLDDGLLVPVLHDCDSLSLLEIAAQATALVERSRSGKPRAEDLTGGTFTISNLGMLPIEHFTAIINQPQAAILAVGAIKERPVVRDGQVTIASTMLVTLSCDHRILDGVTGGQFLQELKSLLENPVGLMV
jgi:pyruvate dehydrogenase E2 component (dihydrolipoamide acetyltransferase)